VCLSAVVGVQYSELCASIRQLEAQDKQLRQQQQDLQQQLAAAAAAAGPEGSAGNAAAAAAAGGDSGNSQVDQLRAQLQALSGVHKVLKCRLKSLKERRDLTPFSYDKK
jgi:chromosome segregation ATPase